MPILELIEREFEQGHGRIRRSTIDDSRQKREAGTINSPERVTRSRVDNRKDRLLI